MRIARTRRHTQARLQQYTIYSELYISVLVYCQMESIGKSDLSSASVLVKFCTFLFADISLLLLQRVCNTQFRLSKRRNHFPARILV